MAYATQAHGTQDQDTQPVSRTQSVSDAQGPATRRTISAPWKAAGLAATLLLGACGHNAAITPGMKLGSAPAPAPADNNFPDTPEICDKHFDYGLCLLTRKAEGVNLQRGFFEALAAVRVVSPANKDDMPFLKEKTIAQALAGKETAYIDLSAGYTKDAASVANSMALPKALREIMGIHFNRVSALDGEGCYAATASTFSFYTDTHHDADMKICKDNTQQSGWRVSSATRKR